MSLAEIKQIILAHKENFQKKYHLKEIGIFGSYVRNEQTPKSDLDILVDFSQPISLFEFLDMEEELEALLRVKVDLVSRKALKPYIGEHILKEVESV